MTLSGVAMSAAVLPEPGQLRMEEVTVPEPAPDEVLIRTEAIGICSTDLMVYRGRYATPLPLIPGHECSGVVERIGSQVSGLHVGDRVVPEASWGCGACQSCGQRDAASCPDRVSLGRTRDGTFAQFVSVPARAVHLLPDNVSFQEGQALVTVACVLRALHRGSPEPGEKVAVFGPGISGLLLTQLAVHSGASSVVVFGTRQLRLDLALSSGANGAVNVRDDDWSDVAQDFVGEQGFDLIFEASGSSDALLQSFQVVRTRGRIVAFSIDDGLVDDFPASKLYSKEVSLLGSRGGAGNYPLAIELLEDKRLKLDNLITHRLPLKEAERGFSLMERREEGVMRVVLCP